jgi:hypothetical protein
LLTDSSFVVIVALVVSPLGAPKSDFGTKVLFAVTVLQNIAARNPDAKSGK